jgi:asparagine synthase (glutamine-hydrolysing)
MSIIFGIIREQGGQVTKEELRRLGSATQRYACEGTHLQVLGEVGFGYQPYFTDKRSELEPGPLEGSDGTCVVFDGRLDNYHDLCRSLEILPDSTSDSEIVLASFARWGEACFGKFVGDWALAIWSPHDASLRLARDHAGSRTLYFSRTGGEIQFSTFLETLIHGDRSPIVEFTYAALYLSSLPTGDLTPYKAIFAVTPAHVLTFSGNSQSRKPHWNWFPNDRIVYRSEEEYEQHFFALFRQAVERRTGPGAPLLAHLSGGVDSSSIVCMSDFIRREQGSGVNDLVDTLSYFNDLEPNWNERPYFTLIEERRGKAGFHIDLSKRKRTFQQVPVDDGFYGFPGGDSGTLASERELQAILGERGYKAILSGIGGDELLGGVPTFKFQLADHVLAGRIGEFSRLAIDSCISTRDPIISLFFEVLKTVGQLYATRSDLSRRPIPPWLTQKSSSVVRRVIEQIHPESRSFGATPSSVAAGVTWWRLLETMPHLSPGYLVRYEYRYPYLDRDLVDFLIRIPKEQLVRPGRRRSLMRRALKSIVPTEVLERPRKAYMSRTRAASLRERTGQPGGMAPPFALEAHGLVDGASLEKFFRLIGDHHVWKWTAALARAAHYEAFLRSSDAVW